MNLISFSVYGPAPRYWHGALRNAVIAAETWPGWTCRFYCDRHNRTTEALEKMGNVELVYRNDQRPGVPMLWRFAPAFDPALKRSDAILFRDADSRLSRREWKAVNDWMPSQCDYHIIKDHPQHATPLLRGGLWGIRGEVFRLLGGFWDFLELWLTKRPLKPRHIDEEFLNEIVASALTTVRFHFPSALREYDNDTTAFIGQSFDEHDHPLN